MPELTLESLAARVAELERQVAEQKKGTPFNNWRRSVGMFDTDPEFMRQVIAEGRAIRKTERNEPSDEDHRE